MYFRVYITEISTHLLRSIQFLLCCLYVVWLLLLCILVSTVSYNIIQMLGNSGRNCLRTIRYRGNNIIICHIFYKFILFKCVFSILIYYRRLLIVLQLILNFISNSFLLVWRHRIYTCQFTYYFIS